MLQPRELAAHIVKSLDAKKARTVRAIEVTEVTVLADYFVIATATSTTHLKTLAEEIEFQLKEIGIEPHHIEGHASGNWILLDYHSVVAHLFLQETRDFYDLERLWGDAPTVNLSVDIEGDKA
ncbi:ribosomal silencing factor RsfS [Clostridia bacterium]|nr:ribosomal silencing factor RsfS [Clostridia bacterium]